MRPLYLIGTFKSFIGNGKLLSVLRDYFLECIASKFVVVVVVGVAEVSSTAKKNKMFQYLCVGR